MDSRFVNFVGISACGWRQAALSSLLCDALSNGPR